MFWVVYDYDKGGMGWVELPDLVYIGWYFKIPLSHIRKEIEENLVL